MGRYSIFLGDCLAQLDTTKEENIDEEEEEMHLTEVNFQYRIALMVASVVPRDDAAPLVEKFEEFLLNTDDKDRFFNDVLTYRPEVFIFLLETGVFLEYPLLFETWLNRDREGCLVFYSNYNFSDELNDAVNNSLLVSLKIMQIYV